MARRLLRSSLPACHGSDRDKATLTLQVAARPNGLPVPVSPVTTDGSEVLRSKSVCLGLEASGQALSRQ